MIRYSIMPGVLVSRGLVGVSGTCTVYSNNYITDLQNINTAVSDSPSQRTIASDKMSHHTVLKYGLWFTSYNTVQVQRTAQYLQ